MRAVVQRVSRAAVAVGGDVVGRIDRQGLLVFVGVTHDDTASQAEALARKVGDLRILDDERSAAQARAPLLVVSQFTLYADTSKGRRPSWSRAAPAERAQPLVDHVVEALRTAGLEVETGTFGADMSVELVNEGPVTLILDV